MFDTIAASLLGAAERLIRLFKERVEVKTGIIRNCDAHAYSGGKSMLSNRMIYVFKRRPYTFCDPNGFSAPSNRQQAREFLTSDATKKIVGSQ